MPMKLQNPPLVEALCEFHFASSEQEWDWTIPGLAYEKLSHDFPLKEQPASKNDSPLLTNMERLQFWRADHSALVQLGPNHLSVHQLAPYTGWVNFKPLITDVLTTYWEVARPQAIQDIALRYVNVIPMPPGRFRFEDNLHVYPKVPGDEDQIWANWAQRVEIVRQELEAMFVLTVGSNASVIEGSSKVRHTVVLDLGFVRMSPEPLPRLGIFNWLETAHQEIEKMFFESVTQECLDRFEPVKRKRTKQNATQ